VLRAGDDFFEPANTRIPHFDAQEQGASFVAHYLLSVSAGGIGKSVLTRLWACFVGPGLEG